MALLRMIDIVKSFNVDGREHRALDRVNFELEAGEVVAIMGPSGAGKTTMLTIGGALQRPTSGIVEVEGEQIQDMPQKELGRVRREKIGFVFQSFNLLEALTALENVMYVLELAGKKGPVAREQASHLLSMLGLGHRMNVVPKRLSGGEQQRVVVARALANEGHIILADEPTANLDHKRAVEVMEMLHRISRDLGRGIMLVTHDMRAHDMADRIFWLEEGHLRRIGHDDAHLMPHRTLRPHTEAQRAGDGHEEPEAAVGAPGGMSEAD
jgi:putative ABC transport system ATP-binding protein